LPWVDAGSQGKGKTEVDRVGDKSDQRCLDGRAIGVFAATGALVMCGLLSLLVGVSRGAPAPSGSADVSLTKSDSPDPVSTGGTLAYSIRVSNAGPDVATNVIVTDNLPKGVSFVSAESTHGSCSASGKNNGRKVTCTLGTLGINVGPAYDPSVVYNPSLVSVTIHVLAPQKEGTISNTATVASDLKDPKSKNNSATATTRVIEAKGPTCGGHRATIVGTSGADVLAGTAGNDVILARAANDRILSFGGRDLICAGAGNDVVKSGARSDKVLAGPGADRLFGGVGGDVLRGGRGPDRIRGGRGADLLAGGPGRDRCFGGPGRDRSRSC
jgi:uncharacterized repeat protein (TIGR01451 family)